MKSVLISIKPKYCELIAEGKKTIEVRKSRPKLKTPFKCYIFCTKNKWQHLVQMPDKSYRIYDGKEYGKFEPTLIFNGEANGKVIGEFVCDRISSLRADNLVQTYFNNKQQTCLTDFELLRYANGQELFYWNISNLKIYDKPKKVTEFWHFGVKRGAKVTKPPQSWYYVEEL